MKTTCLIPVPCKVRRPEKQGTYFTDVGTLLCNKRQEFIGDEGIVYNVETWYEPQSGYFFTEEEMKEILSVASSEKELAELHKEIGLYLSIPTGEALGWRTCFEYVTQLLAPEK